LYSYISRFENALHTPELAKLMAIMDQNNFSTSLISGVEIGSSRSKLINILHARGSSPAVVHPKSECLGSWKAR